MSTIEVSVIVPTRNSSSTIRACLESIRAQTRPVELIVVDNHSTDGTYRIASQFADSVIVSGPERSAQRNVGAAIASTRIVGFIDSDMVLAETIVEEVLAAINDGAASVVIPEETVGVGYWARVSAFERSFYLNSEDVEAPRFFPREVFESVGGFDIKMTGAEDWDLGIRTRNLGSRARTSSFIVHDEGRVRFFSICLKKAYYAPGVAMFFRKHGRSAMSTLTRRAWMREPRKLVSPLGVGLITLKIGQAIAMVAALAWTYLGGKLRLAPRATENIE